MATEPQLLSIERAVRRYDKTVALDGVSFGIRPGEFVALLGPNGAGKSTLMQLLTGHLVADGGTIRMAGFDIGKNPIPALARIGIVFQQPTLDLELSVRANLRFHADLHGLPTRVATERILRELERFGLVAVARQPARTLSGGNRRRVELARALLHDPDLLLMDEPTVGLDPASREAILGHAFALRQGGRVGVLWATHLIDEVGRADRVIVLHRGTIRFDGPPAALAAGQGTASLAAAFLTLTGVDAATAVEMTD
jgi:ABC-2 type transport system ATP-binding protein